MGIINNENNMNYIIKNKLIDSYVSGWKPESLTFQTSFKKDEAMVFSIEPISFLKIYDKQNNYEIIPA